MPTMISPSTTTGVSRITVKVSRARLLLFLPFVLPVLLWAGPARGSDLLELIDLYRTAVKARHAGAIEAAKAALLENPSALNYIMANDPDLFATFEESSPGSVIVGRDEQAEYDAGRPAPDQPVPESRRSVRDQGAGGARKIKQQLLRYEDDLRARAEGEAIRVTVSGVGENERQALGRLLGWEPDFVESIKETGYKAGLVEYQVRLNRATPKEFAAALDNRRVGPFVLDLARFDPRQIDFILKFQ